MDAIEYFKKNGLLKSKMHLDIMNAENWHNEFYGDLKQIVQAFELVERHGGIDSLDDLFYVHGIGSARVMAVGGLTYADAMKAINLVEKCSASD